MRLILLSLTLIILPLIGMAQVAEIDSKVFKFEFEQNFPGQPDVIFDAATGDISGWWDHTFAENPIRLVIEPKPGGNFYEIFNEQGDGVVHATVTGAQRGKFLRMEGPLGLAGRATHMVSTYHFSELTSDSTKLKLEVHMAGEIDQKLAEVVQNVWRHFIVEQFTPYIEQGKHLQHK